MYRGTGAIMWLGNAKFKQKGEQAEPDGTEGETFDLSQMKISNLGSFLLKLGYSLSIKFRAKYNLLLS